MLLLPSAADGRGTAITHALTSASTLCQVEPVGRWFEAFVKRRNRNASASFQELEDKKELSEESEDEELQLEEFPMLKTLDPKDWKNQDHYAVLGLGHVRYKATQRQIKAAHKAMVLKHHPDKRKAAGEPIKEGDNDYFTCITKAYEMLSDPVKRRAFNSVDPTFDNSVPSKSEAKDNFFEVFTPVFERNSRWSNKKNVPKLGDMNSSFEDVDIFYSFWYNFDSWREFSYLDEEEKEKAECRDERRWIEKQNRATRAQRKKEEMNRIRTLVDNAYSCDPRIKKFKEEEKAKKEAEKKAKAEAKRKEQEAKEKQRQAELEAARLAKEKEEEEVRQQALLAKKEKDIQKKAIKKERQKLRNSCKIEEINEQIRKEKEEAEARMRQASKNTEKSTGGGGNGSKNWSEDDLQLLIKAVNLFPAGTNSRWEVIANYMNIHSSSGVKRTAKDVIGKAKSLQKLDPHQKDDINKKAFDKFKKEHGVVPQADNATPSERFEGPYTDFTPWTTEEQKLLEQALKTYPVNTPERWEKIAEAVPGRTKKDCMKRYKELVEMVKAKKAAQEQVLNASRAKK
ncbi:DnaJ heat shock protein family (Hsp40) member C2 [Homo sapiens]|uniref:Isoform 2 of DnaJ homolog subfamily C member 2 n=1 Tax=Homo sapiens TaxID=9606 RepID=Q99543-2|nr:dnaJ homolog subfamily C member 2 isoform 2 [Homo sapiens]EAW83329.1 hCG18199, isoform CRA_a [Homo sapiens]KAI2547275.1 DnaJ heat shock protein family (Hsp40) member C2 [Homo sapiens]KAI4015198.1 DnaJ heat shock protein family (Hsp40) member C2 [Homo sapiens]|eukprot:NP_001123359.1 dnaJ homolog subfamily C member 2 isoform 2 [Homo sapiens]